MDKRKRAKVYGTAGMYVLFIGLPLLLEAWFSRDMPWFKAFNGWYVVWVIGLLLVSLLLMAYHVGYKKGE